MAHKCRCYVALVLCCFVALACSSPSAKVSQKRNIPIEFKDGDIAFRRGMGAASRAVLISNQRGSFSHMGVVMQIDGEWCVIHEVPYEGTTREADKIYSEEVGEFFNTLKAGSGAIYRLEGLDSAKRQTIRSYILRQLSNQTPFDHEYDLSDSTRLYCSELVWRGYLEIGVDISRGSRTRVSLPGFAGEHIMPCDVEINEELNMIYRF